MTLRDMLTLHEGKRKRPYRCSAGKLTIGVGHNIEDEPLDGYMSSYLEKHLYITEEMIQELLDKDIEDAITDCVKLYPDFDSFSENVQNALIDFLFNVGYKTASTFKQTNKAINRKDFDTAADLLLKSKYAKQVGKRAVDIADLLREG